MKNTRYLLLVPALALLAACEINDGYNKEHPEPITDTTVIPPKDNSSLHVGSVTDCEENTYPLVKIGDQIWMAENLRCTKYDTESEKAGQHIFTTQAEQGAPYYIDPFEITDEFSENLVQYHRNKLGYLYNWSAAMGLTSAEAEKMDIEADEPRQGLCPNGYHLPTQAEWHELLDAVGGEQQAAIKLKATTGWYVGDAYHEGGTDDYGFEALPAGYAQGPLIGHLGVDTRFWTATPYGYTYANQIYLQYYPEGSLDMISGKTHAVSVRCIKN
ncbi:MAG: hypothetical protein J6Z12_01225 [Paludibacteraceae bacterium]|nr:hypothetical protein [Paludibacteraceae bacterium]